MKVNITSKHTNELLKRTEIMFEAKDVRDTPSRKELKKEIVRQTGTKPELVVINRLDQGFGTKVVRGKAHVYETEDHLKQLEPQYLVTRTNGKTEEKEKLSEDGKTEGKKQAPGQEPKEEKADEKKE